MKHLAYTFLFVASFAACTDFVIERDYTAFWQILNKQDEKIKYTRTSETEKQLAATAIELAHRMSSCIDWKNETECKKISAFFATISNIKTNSEEEQIINMMLYRMTLAGFGDIKK